MKKKRIDIGSISLLLVIIAFFWSFEILGFCLGDSILATLNIPTWSNNANASGIHYTIYYTFIFLVPALILGIKNKEDLFAQTGKWLAIIYMGILIIAVFLMAI